MFKEKFLIFKIDIPPQGPRKKLKLSDRPPLSPDKKQELMHEVKEAEKQQEEEEIRIREKLLEGLEISGLECERCGGKNVMEDRDASELDPAHTNLYCRDCGYRWREEK